MANERAFLRHTLATLAYRAAKATRGAPSSFADFHVSPTSRTPVEILKHMGDLMEWGLRLASETGTWKELPPQSWDEELARFHSASQAFDEYLASDAKLVASAERLFQGPIADALTHTGQINLLRRIFGSPVRGENYSRASIASGRVGADQAPPDPQAEFD